MTERHPHLILVERGIYDQAARDPRMFEGCTDDIVVRYPVAGPEHPKILRGKAELASYSNEVSSVLPVLAVSDLRLDLLADGSSVVAEFEYATLPNAAMTYRSRYCTLARFRGDLVCEYTMYFDAGALPTPA